ncbi:MAG: hypothetical protein LBP80_02105 [Treponema sp.]|nr:hypothetical protein [Treponema sp.]
MLRSFGKHAHRFAYIIAAQFAGLTLTAADFTVTGEAEISSATVGGDTVSVKAAFAPNTGKMAKTYTVGIAPLGTRIKGSGTVAITHAAPVDVDSVDELSKAIAAVKTRPPEADRVTIRLTKTFYAAANAAAGFIAVDAGPDDNATPYTIRGLGTKPGNPALNAGILLANGNIAPEDVKFAVNDSAKAAPCSWENYKAAGLCRPATAPGRVNPVH